MLKPVLINKTIHYNLLSLSYTNFYSYFYIFQNFKYTLGPR